MANPLAEIASAHLIGIDPTYCTRVNFSPSFVQTAKKIQFACGILLSGILLSVVCSKGFLWNSGADSDLVISNL